MKEKHRDHAAMTPIRFEDALQAEEVDGVHWLLASRLTMLCYQCRNTSGGVAIVRLSALIELLNVPGVINLTDETVRRKLHDLQDWGWIECSTRRGPSAAWRIRLTGLASPAAIPTDFHSISTENPVDEWKYTPADISTEAPDENGASPLGERDASAAVFPLEPPQERTPGSDTRPDPTRPFALKEDQREVLGSLRGDGLRNFRPLAFHEHLIEQVAAGAMTQAEAAELWQRHNEREEP